MKPFYKLTCDVGHVTFADPGSELERHRIENGSPDPLMPMHIEIEHCHECLKPVAKHIASFGTTGPL